MIDWMHAFVDVDTVEPTRSFWSAVSGWPVGAPWDDHPEFHSLEPPDGAPYLHVQRVGAPARVHLDLMSQDVDADRDAHVAHGATAGARFPWWQVMTSPGGLPYCLVTEHRRRTVPAATRWPDGHRSRVSQLCVDIPTDGFDREVAFWQAVTGWAPVTATRPEFRRLGPPSGCPLDVLLQRLGPGESGPVRAHLDVGTDDVSAEVARLAALGASVVDREHPWTVLTDPAGLPFCVIPRSPR
jgi:glyoxalase superfamily protein